MDSPTQHWPLSFPPELLVRILYLSLSESLFHYIQRDQYGDLNLSLRLDLSEMTTPFTLGAVCRHWRQVVWQEPNMWTYIYLVANPHKADIQAWLLEIWLSRIGNLFISIDIDCSCQEHKRWTSRFANESMVLMEPIFRYSNRCKSFRTRLPPQCLLLPSERAAIPRPYFKELTTLEVVPMNLTEGVDDEEDEEVAVVSIFRSSTSLRQLALCELEVEQLDLPWSSLHLTTISTRSLSLVDCLLLMKYAPNVEMCNFNGIGYPEIDFDDSHNVVLPQLHALVLDFTEISSPYEVIFRHITTPNLRQLQFLAEIAAPFPAQDFVLFLQRSGCHLADLEIKWANMTADAIRACLSPISQSLARVQIDIESYTDQEPVLSRMIPPSSYFPRIQTATITGPASVIKELLPSPH